MHKVVKRLRLVRSMLHQKLEVEVRIQPTDLSLRVWDGDIFGDVLTFHEGYMTFRCAPCVGSDLEHVRGVRST